MSLSSSFYSLLVFVMYLTLLLFLLSAQVHLQITDEQESFIRWVLEIPFEQRKWKDLVTLDTFHAFCGGLVPTPIARQLHVYTRCCKLYFYSSFSNIPSTILILPSYFCRNGRRKAEGLSKEGRRYA